MRKCLRCGADMIEECGLRESGGASGIVVTDSMKLFADVVGKLHAAVCPACGEVSMYLENTDKLKNRK